VTTDEYGRAEGSKHGHGGSRGFGDWLSTVMMIFVKPGQVYMILLLFVVIGRISKSAEPQAVFLTSALVIFAHRRYFPFLPKSWVKIWVESVLNTATE
jgi:hypothetical protein